MSLLFPDLKKNQVIIYNEDLPTITGVLDTSGHCIAYAKIYSKAFKGRKDEVPDIANVCRQRQVVPYVGGGVTEKAIEDDDLFGLTQTLHRLGIDTIEVSNSDAQLEAHTFRQAVVQLRRDFSRVFVEIGSKWGTEGNYRIDNWMRDLDLALELGADEIILEGAGDGRCGIYHSDEGVKTLLVARLLERLSGNIRKVIIEAALAPHQSYWIKQGLGHEVKLGNVPLARSAQDEIARQRIDMMMPDREKHVLTARQQLLGLSREVEQFCSSKGIPMDVVLSAPELAHIPFGEHGIIQRIASTLKDKFAC